MELTRRFAGEVERAIEVARAELAQRELEEHAGFAEARWCLEED